MSNLEHWNDRYISREIPWEGISEWFVETVEKYDPWPRTALDLGCGTGDKSIWLAGQGYEVTGIDFSEEAVRMARKASGGKKNPRFVAANISDGNLVFPDRIGLALDLVSIQFLKKADQEKVFDKIAKCLSPEGILVHTRLKADNDESTPWIRNLSVTPAEFEKSLKGLRVLRHTEHKAINHPATTVHRYVLRKSD